jgi:hypothetical protein
MFILICTVPGWQSASHGVATFAGYRCGVAALEDLAGFVSRSDCGEFDRRTEMAKRSLVPETGGLRRGKMDGVDAWIRDAAGSGIYGMRGFARGLRKDLAAVRNALITKWSNGQVEGQINRLKTLKRAMYGRVSVEVLRARLLPLSHF